MIQVCLFLQQSVIPVIIYNASTPTALAMHFKRLQYAEVNKQKENELLLAKNDNNKLQEIIQTLHLENERLKRKINDLIDENENLNEQLKKSKKGFFSKLFG